MKRILILVVTCILNTKVYAVETEVDIAKEGSCRGKEQARDGAEVTLDYDGYLQDSEGNTGKKFTSTYSLDAPFSFTIGGSEVILGLEQGLSGFCAGSELILYIPSELAYGQKGAGDTIPPGASLVFEVVIIDVKILETQYEKNLRLEAKSREDEAKRREEELERRKIAEIKAKEDYAILLAEDAKRIELIGIKAKEAHDILLAEEEKRREVAAIRVKEADIKAKETYDRQIAEDAKRREEQQVLVRQQQELVRQELIRREEQQKLVDEELERRKVQQELVRLDLKAREDEAERRRLELIAREEQKERVAAELLEREDENVRRIIDQNARQHDQERRDEEEQKRLGGIKLKEKLSEEEEKINQARIFFMNRRTRIRQRERDM
eukprot:GFUD01005386.1.p1 GENE.GFUD01005386.1~~GFUD01005386.1.p1  ORF type:complete len:382 (-),score=108.59 GFUD01005386.1:351-1496(-)